MTRQDCARIAAAALLHSEGKAIHDVTGPAVVTHGEVASLLSRFSGKPIQYVSVTPDEVEKGLVSAGLPPFAARSVRGLDEEAARGYQAILSSAVEDLTGNAPMPLEEFLKVAVSAMLA